MFQIKQRSLILTSVNLPQLFKPQTHKMLLLSQNDDILPLSVCLTLQSTWPLQLHLSKKLHLWASKFSAVFQGSGCTTARLKQPEENTPGIQSPQRAEGIFCLFFIDVILLFRIHSFPVDEIFFLVNFPVLQWNVYIVVQD